MLHCNKNGVTLTRSRQLHNDGAMSRCAISSNVTVRNALKR